jgi:hypothetical protein
VEVDRGAAHGAEFDDADEVAELAQFHGGDGRTVGQAAHGT